MTAALRVVAPGLMTTLQDLGRRGYQRLGIPVSGALDPVSLRAANLIAGNAAETAALEIAYQGPTLTVDADSVRVALAGAAASVEVLAANDAGEARRVPPLTSIRLIRGERVRIGALSGGSIAYLAIEGGFAVEPTLGSRSTFTRAGMGGFAGRAIAAGDVLPLRSETATEREERMLPDLDLARPDRFRVVLGPQDDYFSAEGIATLLGATYTVSPATDRMGMRLEGPKLQHAKGFDIVSDGIAPGAIQVPGNGLPIVLLADRQTTGGYPKIATVISADLPALARLTPGAKVAFAAVGIEEAEEARRQLATYLAQLEASIAPARPQRIIDTARLLAANLVSGVVDARMGSVE